ncbi:MAG: hypothetical protein M3159_05810, partial [Actinomycetota bacterium]|nr:hypothetical protein [Actinomycetota bacterium]
MNRRLTLPIALLAALLVVAGTGVVVARQSDGSRAPAAVVTMLPQRPPDPLVIQVQTTEAPATTAAPPTTGAPAPAAPAKAAAAANDSAPAPSAARNDSGSVYAGLGTWVDVFDWDPDHTGGNPTVTPASVSRMAAVGVKTLYLQAARPEDPASPGDLVHPEILSAFVQRAHAAGIAVVGWYLPHLG